MDARRQAEKDGLDLILDEAVRRGVTEVPISVEDLRGIVEGVANLHDEIDRLKLLGQSIVDGYCELGASVGYSAALVQAWRRELRG